MILFRIGNELYLLDGTPYTGDKISYLVYDGVHGDPDNFYFFNSYIKEELKTLYYLIIIKSGLILINYGTIDQIKKGVWYAHHHERHDVPVDLCFYNLVPDNMNFVILLLYSDLAFTEIRLMNDEFNISHQNNYLPIEGNDEVNLPVTTLHKKMKESAFFIVKDASGKILSIQHELQNPRLNVLIMDDYPEPNREIVEVTKYASCLYSNGNFFNGEKIFADVIKADINIILRGNNNLEYYENDRNNEKIVVAVVDNVDNFYRHISRENFAHYILRNDQLLSASVHSNWQVLIEEGASEILFPTESYYDSQLVPIHRQAKSAYKR